MISSHPVKLGDHKHCGSGDMTFLAVEVQNSPCSSLNLPILFVSKLHGISCSHTRNIRMQTWQFAMPC